MTLESQSLHHWQTHTFAEKDGLEIQLDYLPPLREAGAEAKTPFFFFIHGGAFVSGNRKVFDPWIVGLARKMKFGFVSVDYRLCPEVTLSEGVQDVADAWQFVTSGRLDPLLDGQKGVALGVSAGGYYLMHAGVSFQPRPFALIDIYGIPAMTGELLSQKNDTLPEAMTILDPLFDEAGKALMEALKATKPVSGSFLSFPVALGFPKEAWQQVGIKNGFQETEWTGDAGQGHDMSMTDGLRAKMSPYALYHGLIGQVVGGNGREEDNLGKEVAGNRLAERDPIRRIDGTFPPFFSIHGDADAFVPYSLKAQLVDHLRTFLSGRQAPRLITVPGEGHMCDLMWDTESSQVDEVYQWLSSLF